MTGLISLTYRDKLRAINKLRAVYGVHLGPRPSADRLGHEVAIALRVQKPLSLLETTRMIYAFSRAARSQLVDDLVAQIKAKHPFTPLTLSKEMQRALARVAEARSIGTSSDGRESK